MKIDMTKCMVEGCTTAPTDEVDIIVSIHGRPVALSLCEPHLKQIVVEMAQDGAEVELAYDDEDDDDL